MKYLLGIDCGTSGTKTVLFDERGNAVSSASASYPLYQPQNGYAEQDAADWKSAMLETVAQVIAKSGIDSAAICGIGLSALHTKKHMLRAVMEGVAFSLRDCVEIFRQTGVDISNMAACGGGAASPLWRSMLADLYGCEVKTVANKEGPALGAAILASVGAGIYSGVEQACDALVKPDKVCAPDSDRAGEYEKYYQLYTKLYPSLKDNYSILAEL